MFKFIKARKKISLIKDLLNSIDTLFFEVNSRDESKDLIIELITGVQLYEDGENGDGVKLGDYSPYTIEIKKSKGQKYDHITLEDTGEFYRSFDISVRKGEIVIIAETIKEQTDLIQQYGPVTKLNKESVIFYRRFVKKAIIQSLHKEILSIRGVLR